MPRADRLTHKSLAADPVPGTPSKRKPRKADLLKSAVFGQKNKPALPELVESVIREFGGMDAVGKAMRSNYLAAAAGSQTRVKILETIVKFMELSNQQYGTGDEFGTMTDDDLMAFVYAEFDYEDLVGAGDGEETGDSPDRPDSRDDGAASFAAPIAADSGQAGDPGPEGATMQDASPAEHGGSRPPAAGSSDG